MAPEPTTPPTTPPTSTPAPAEPPPATPPAAGAPVPPEAVEALRREAAEARSRIRELESQIAVSSDAGKSDLERATSRAERAEKKLAGLEGTVLRQGVATERKVPLELLPALDDRAALEAHADRLLKWGKELVEAAAATQPRRSSVLADPARGAPVADAADMNDFIRSGFRR